MFVLTILVFESWVGRKEGVLVVSARHGVDGNVGEASGRYSAAGEAEGRCNAGAAGHPQGPLLGVLLPYAHARLPQLFYCYSAAEDRAS